MRGSEDISVVMIGDCAYVGSTLIKYSPPGISYKHIKRTRGLISKTIGIALKIAFSRGDIYHVHYGLQDHLIARWLGKEPTVCHFHGSDLRYTLRSRWGWIVKENLRKADAVLIAVPDILEVAREYRDDARYIPNPVDIDMFKPIDIQEHEDFRVLLASDLSFIKGIDRFVKEFSIFQKEFPNSILRVIKYGRDASFMLNLLRDINVRYEVIPYQPHDKMVDIYGWADVVVTDMSLGYLHMSSLEAMACMRPVVQYINRDYYKEIPAPPVISTDEVDLKEALSKLMDLKERKRIARLQFEYVLSYHNPKDISRKVVEIYNEILSRT